MLKDKLLSPPAMILGGLAARNDLLRTGISKIFHSVSSLPGMRQLAYRSFEAYKEERLKHDGSNAVELIALPGGARMYVRLNERIARASFSREYPEPATIALVQNQIRPTDVFLDIGANFGLYSLLVAKGLAAGGKVIAFEPLPAVLAVLRRSIAASQLSDRIDVYPVALSDSDQERDFYVSQNPITSEIGSLTPWEGHFASGDMDRNSPITVQCRSLDSFLKDHPLERIDMMKIDVEGAELQVIGGMHQTLAKFRPRLLIIETTFGGPVGAELKKLGYSERMHESLDGNWGNVCFEIN